MKIIQNIIAWVQTLKADFIFLFKKDAEIVGTYCVVAHDIEMLKEMVWNRIGQVESDFKIEMTTIYQDLKSLHAELGVAERKAIGYVAEVDADLKAKFKVIKDAAEALEAKIALATK